MNTLYYGDNLDILRRYIKDESVDLVYLDPPFNSNATYNVLFAQKDGSQSSAQIQAFEDTWQWDENAVRTYEEDVEKGGPVADALRITQFNARKGAFYLGKTLKSAIANAENNFNMDKKNLYVAECFVCPGPMLKRIRPRAQGRAFRVMKRTSHVTMVLREKE